MRLPAAILLSLQFFVLISGSTATPYELSGYIEAEGRLFFRDALHSEQEQHNASLAFQPEYYREWESGSSLSFVPFGRLDSADSRRTHFDIRELNYLLLQDQWELRLGIGKVFWGVTEFVHLVDIINQTDLVENIDLEDKLGQPMVQLTVPRDWGVLELFVLPYFRERTYPGRKGRLRFSPVVDTDSAIYESSAKETHTDLALRYSHSIGNWDIGLYQFRGTGRDPLLLPQVDGEEQARLIPFYEQIDQTGLDLQLVAGEWLWKLETIYRHSRADDFFAGVGGFEYTFVNVAASGVDVGALFEYAYDERGDRATTPYENDAMAGMRLTLNDAASSELLAGFIQSVSHSTRILRLEASRRLSSNLKAVIEGWGFFDVSSRDILYTLRRDDHLRFTVVYYF